MRTNKITTGGIIAAIYIALTFVTSLFGFSSGPIQLRLSEALCILPCFTTASIPGLFVGCMLSNLLFGGGIFDVIVGGIATLIGALGTFALRRNRYIASLSPVIANALLLPFVFSIAYGFTQGYWYFFLTIFISELISAGILGQILYSMLEKNNQF